MCCSVATFRARALASTPSGLHVPVQAYNIPVVANGRLLAVPPGGARPLTIPPPPGQRAIPPFSLTPKKDPSSAGSSVQLMQ